MRLERLMLWRIINSILSTDWTRHTYWFLYTWCGMETHYDHEDATDHVTWAITAPYKEYRKFENLMKFNPHRPFCNKHFSHGLVSQVEFQDRAGTNMLCRNRRPGGMSKGGHATACRALSNMSYS